MSALVAPLSAGILFAVAAALYAVILGCLLWRWRWVRRAFADERFVWEIVREKWRREASQVKRMWNR